MTYELVIVKQKWYKNKVYIISLAILSAIVLLISVFLGYKKINQIKSNEEAIINKLFQKQPILHECNFKKEVTITDEIKERMENIYYSEEKRVFLTFDDGPSKTVTPLILDLLKQENIKATFFTLGSRIEFYPELVKREYDEGHYIANHGYSHQYSSIYSSTTSVLEEYYKTEQLIKNAIEDQEYNSYLFRFPGGSQGGKYKNLKKEAIDALDEQNILHIDWNALTGDAEGKKTSEAMMEYLIETIDDKQSIVILMHDAGDKMVTYETLPEIIKYLRENGYSFKSFYDIIK